MAFFLHNLCARQKNAKKWVKKDKKTTTDG